MFSKYDDLSIGGCGSPCAVMKDGGECLSLSSVLDCIGDELRCSLMDGAGDLTEISDDDLDEFQNRVVQMMTGA